MNFHLGVGASRYDLDSEPGPNWIRELQRRKEEACLWYFMSGVPYEIEGRSRGSFSGGFEGGDGGGDGGSGGGGGGGCDGGDGD